MSHCDKCSGGFFFCSFVFLSALQNGNHACLFCNEVHTRSSERRLVWSFTVGGGGSICFAGTCSKADTKDWMLPLIKPLHLFSFQPMFLLFVYFLTVPEFILLFSTVTFHICIYFPVEMVLGASEAVCWLLFSLPLSLFPRSLLQHSFAMPFHPLPSYCWAPFELFKSGLGYCSISFKISAKPCLG